MADFVQRTDWSGSPVGDPSGWPLALSTIVETVLANPFPMLVFWGPRLVMIYNDAYRMIIGAKHPKALGQPADECFAEIWDVIGPDMEAIYAGAASVLNRDRIIDLNRRGFVEETYFTFSFSPLPDPEAKTGIGGVLATVQETTGKVVNERRITLLRDLAVRSAQARCIEDECRLAATTLANYPNDVPFAMIYLVDAREATARLAASSGFDRGGRVRMETIDLTEKDTVLARAIADANQPVLFERLDELLYEVPPGPWPEAAVAASIVPLRSSASHRLLGFLVSGLNARLPFDESSKAFYGLLGTQLSSAIVNAWTFEQEQGRVKESDFLSEASRILAESLNVHETLANIARLTIPDFADYCQIDLCRPDGSIQTVAIAHRDERKEQFAQQFVGRAHLDPNGDGNAYVIRTGKSRLIPEFPPGVLEAAIGNDDELRIYRELGTKSAACIPLKARGTTLGAIGVVYGDSNRRYTAAALPALEELGRRAGLAIQNASAFERQHRVAESFQEASLPSALPTMPGLTFDAVYVPSSDEAKVGGDWYDAVRLFDGRIVVSIGDVAGSGLKAAVTMGNMRQIIRGIAQVHADPALMLDAADRALRLEQPDLYVTAFVGVLDPVAQTLSFASAGHPPAMLRHADGTVDLLSDGGLPLGLRAGRENAAKTIDIPNDSCLLFYTDGLTELERDAIAGETKLRDVFSRPDICAASQPAEAIRRRFLEGMPAHDDVAILVIQVAGVAEADRSRTPNDRWTFDARFAEAAQSARREFSATLRERGLSAEDASSAEIVLGELLGNVARYAPGPVEVSIDWSGAAPVLHVLDRGPGFRHIAILPDVYSESGRGLFMVSSLTQDFHVAKRPHGGSHARAVLRMQRQSLHGAVPASLFWALID